MYEEWTNAGFSESEALAWRNAGFTLKQALAFREAKITFEQVIALREQQGGLAVQPNETMQKAKGMKKVANTIKTHLKSIGIIIGIILVIILAALAVVMHHKNNSVNIIGDWSGLGTLMDKDSNQESVKYTIGINQKNSDGTISGNVNGSFDDGGPPFTGTVHGNTIDLTWSSNWPYATGRLTGTVDGNEITANIKYIDPTSPSKPLLVSIQLYKDDLAPEGQ